MSCSWLRWGAMYAAMPKLFGSFARPLPHRDYWSRKESFNPVWSKRAALASTFIVPGSWVVDVGCGQMQLRDYLPTGCRYTPADLTQWTEEVHSIDLDAGQFPPGTYDCAVILGVLEYLQQPQDVLQWAQSTCDRLVVSYCHPTPVATVRNRRRKHWINGFSESEFRDLLIGAGWHVSSTAIHSTRLRHQQVVYSCRSASL